MMNKIVRFLIGLVISGALVLPLVSAPQYAAAQQSPVQTPTTLRLGMIGLDTSHVIRFAELLNDPTRPGHVPGARIVAAYKGGSPDVKESATRIERFTAEIRDKWKIELVDSIEELCRKVDAVLLMSVDGRKHLPQVRPVFAAKKPVFIDKPFTGSLRDAREIVRLARESGVPFFSSSPRRFSADIQSLKQNADVGEVRGAFTYGPSPIETYIPDLFWYGIHSVEALYTLMGPGCESVTRVHTDGTDVVVGRWKDGRIGTMRGNRDSDKAYGAVVFGTKAVRSIPLPKSDAPRTTGAPSQSGYHGVVSAVVKFFQTGVPPVSPEETLEIIAFMEAADVSKARQGAPVALKELMQERAGKATDSNLIKGTK
ncbi:MAG: Gfo/Idh/MocA family oxidoreductase [Acidobacteriota bacterium]|nr:Gfo/Idh/MocA family oxidoreductase [Acidobacteriota bacterium]